MEKKCEGLQRLGEDAYVRSERRIWCCCFTVVISRRKEVKVKSGVLPELPMRPKRKKGGRMDLHCCGSLNIRIKMHDQSQLFHNSRTPQLSQKQRG